MSRIHSRILVLVLHTLLVVGSLDVTRAQDALPHDDAVRIAEAREIAGRFGDATWSGWSGAPFAILLVTDETEYLVYHSDPTDDFAPAGYDSLVGGDVYTRDRVYEPDFQATFPAVAGVPTIVIGRPKKTEASHSSRWVLTLLHEHFHQWQFSQPDYYELVDGLELANGDSTGMWMLDYAFPYDSTDVGVAFKDLCTALAEAIEASDDATWEEKLAKYREVRTTFERAIEPDDYRYFSFQVWQEGISRYTEYRLAMMLASTYMPTPEFEALSDYVPFEEVAERMKEHIVATLTTMELDDLRRSAFYHVGAGEGLLLDRYYPWWKKHYMEKRFFVERYFEMRPY